MVITRVPGGPHGSEFGMSLTTISPNIFYTQRDRILIELKVFSMFLGEERKGGREEGREEGRKGGREEGLIYQRIRLYKQGLVDKQNGY